MRDGMQHRRVGDTDPVVVYPPTHRWQHVVMCVILLVYSGLLLPDAHAAERARPLRIGALNGLVGSHTASDWPAGWPAGTRLS